MSEPISTARIIGHYQGPEHGPLVIAVGGAHGNEPAGVQALEQLFDLLEEEPQINPAFSFKGELLALRGNLAALAKGVRYIDHDLNRIWVPERIATLRQEMETPFASDTATSEEKEMLKLLDVIEITIEEAKPTEVILLDLHTTTADGGIFTITGDDVPSLQLGAELYAPVIKGMLKGLSHTTLHYFRDRRFGKNINLRALTFEAGSHYDPISVDRALAAVINLLRGCGCVQDADVRTTHDEILQISSEKLPRLTELAFVYRLDNEEQFTMLPGFKNFDPIAKGQVLANNRDGAVEAPCDGYMLMPLYQKKGQEGFFVVQDFTLNEAY